MSDISRNRDPGHLQVRAISYEELAQDTPLTFPPPLADRSPRPEVFERWWRWLEYVFHLPPAADFPTLPRQPDSADADALERYVSAAEEMAESELLVGDDVMTIRQTDQNSPEEIDSEFSSKELTRGFITLFRQFDTRNKKEEASFECVQAVLRRLNAGDDQAPERTATLDRWRQARAKLGKTTSASS